MNLTNTEKKIFDLLLEVATQHDTTIRAAGGWVRDKLLGYNSDDIDISIDNMTGEKFANLVANHIKSEKVSIVKANPEQSKHLETAMLDIYGVSVDFANLRKENYTDSRIPIMEIGTPEEDALRRDLTINALFFNINENKLEDFVGGLEDLDDLLAVTPLDPEQTFIDDPLRILRIVRFASKYNLEIDPQIFNVVKKAEIKDALINKVSPERILKEMIGSYDKNSWKPGFLNGNNPYKACKILAHMNLQKLIFGLTEEEEKKIDRNIVNFDDLTVWNYNISILKNISLYGMSAEDSAVMSFSSIFSNVDKESTEYILNRLKVSNKVLKRVLNISSHYTEAFIMDPNISDKYLRKFLRDIGDDWKLLLILAQNSSNSDSKKYTPIMARICDLIKDMGGLVPKRPINGKDLLELKFEGKKIGEILRFIDNKLLEKPSMSKNEALELVNNVFCA